jgi:Zn-dependent M28 family amino/carboxypeptidase
MRKPALVCLLVSALLCLPAFGQSARGKGATTRHARAKAMLPPAAFVALRDIHPDRIRAQVRFLSSDWFEGRGTGQRGGDLAAQYIATQFELYGLKPAGDNGTYLQKVPMVGITTEPSTTVSLVPQQGPATTLRPGDDVVAMDESQNPHSEVDGELLYVGYGIEAPEYHWNDYKDVDVRGKVLLMLVNEPPSDDPQFFQGKALTYYGRWTYKFEQAARKGAAGVILIHKTDMASYGWNVVRSSWSGERSSLRAGGQPKLKLAAWIQLEVAKKIAADSGRDLDKMMEQARSRDFRPEALPFRVKARMVSQIRPFDSNNVLAVLPGSNPDRKDEAVVYTAHYDHLGIRPAQPGDNIYNGAVDNGTGCGILLEMARAAASVRRGPPRSILFAAVTGEEQGLLGSEYLGQHPPFPAGNITLALNFDGLEPIGAPEEAEVSGAERTTFYPIVQAMARLFRLEIRPDSNPGAGHYYRSDHFSLARVGIPAFSVNQGTKFRGHPAEWGMEREKEFNDKDYHQPSDEFRANWEFSGLAEMARFGLALGWKAATIPQLIGWQSGDEFAAVREASRR